MDPKKKGQRDPRCPLAERLDQFGHRLYVTSRTTRSQGGHNYGRLGHGPEFARASTERTRHEVHRHRCIRQDHNPIPEHVSDLSPEEVEEQVLVDEELSNSEESLEEDRPRPCLRFNPRMEPFVPMDAPLEQQSENARREQRTISLRSRQQGGGRPPAGLPLTLIPRDESPLR